MINIMIADDHTLMREGLKQILSSCPDIRVCCEAESGDEVLKQLRQSNCDLLLLDMSMPGKSGLDLVKQIKDERPQLPILVLSMHKEEQYASRVLKSGAAGYLCKDRASSELVNAIRKVAAGGLYITPAAAENIAKSLQPMQTALPHTLLSDREFQIFKRIVAGQGLTDIANRLFISVKTVSTHKTRILQKMGVESTAELVRYAIEHDLFSGAD